MSFHSCVVVLKTVSVCSVCLFGWLVQGCAWAVLVIHSYWLFGTPVVPRHRRFIYVLLSAQVLSFRQRAINRATLYEAGTNLYSSATMQKTVILKVQFPSFSVI
ncbi:hypothetical protein, unlikely [Trypanosoma brucei brucei TREU927]|uniref:Uncharacterized protein n=1 Tax=Trypanosoma brucei brucei (strain 927/4 GUTat10.1) TaxID=185431 RepID=Q38CP1_TRYB2|nr:hypothetical protein, unlikely [Trypanosoma brucei brucei TREU927]EAN77429.1 hypothetical protein, unlikely [Trypanosoma brucei brucei TREU927]